MWSLITYVRYFQISKRVGREVSVCASKSRADEHDNSAEFIIGNAVGFSGLASWKATCLLSSRSLQISLSSSPRRSQQFPGERRDGPHPENIGGSSESKHGVNTLEILKAAATSACQYTSVETAVCQKNLPSWLPWLPWLSLLCVCACVRVWPFFIPNGLIR